MILPSSSNYYKYRYIEYMCICDSWQRRRDTKLSVLAVILVRFPRCESTPRSLKQYFSSRTLESMHLSPKQSIAFSVIWLLLLRFQNYYEAKGLTLAILMYICMGKFEELKRIERNWRWVQKTSREFKPIKKMICKQMHEAFFTLVEFSPHKIQEFTRKIFR